MKKVKYGIVLIATVLLIMWGFFSIGKIIFIKYTGEKIEAIVSKIPSSCDKYNHINVLFNGEDYEVSISRTDCQEGFYKIGQKVTLIKNKKYKELVWPESQPELLPILIIAVFVLAYISMKGRNRK
jgi:hypothetical protein